MLINDCWFSFFMNTIVEFNTLYHTYMYWGQATHSYVVQYIFFKLEIELQVPLSLFCIILHFNQWIGLKLSN